MLPWRTVAGNISLVLEDHPLSKSEREARIAEVLETTNLSDFAMPIPSSFRAA